MKKLLKRALWLTTVLVSLTSWLIVFAEGATTLSVVPAWHAEPEMPQHLLDKIK